MAIIEEATEFRKKQYDQATPIPAKFLHSDGTVDENIGSGGTSLEYKLYAWEVSIDHTTIGYTEVEDVEVGDVLLIPENTGVGPITDTNQLKKKGLVTSVSEGHITVEIEEGHEIVFERDSENDWTETITDIKGTLDISQNGLLVAEKGKVMKSIDVNAGGAGGKLFAYSTDIPDPYFEIRSALMYSFTEITEPGDYNFCQPKATTTGDYYFIIAKQTLSITSIDSDGNITDSDDMTYNRVADKDITL